MNKEQMAVKLKKGESHVVVHLRPSPGCAAPEPVVVQPCASDRAMKVQIGQAGELMVTRNVEFMLFGKYHGDVDQIVQVFAPHAWLYYEFIVEEDGGEL